VVDQHTPPPQPTTTTTTYKKNNMAGRTSSSSTTTATTTTATASTTATNTRGATRDGEEEGKGVRAVVGFLQPTEELVRRLEKAFKVTPSGKWQLSCTLYLSTKSSKQLQKQQQIQQNVASASSSSPSSTPALAPGTTSLEKELYVFWFETEAPQKYFLVSKNVILETEPELLSIIIHNSKLYEKRQLFQIKVLRSQNYVVAVVSDLHILFLSFFLSFFSFLFFSFLFFQGEPIRDGGPIDSNRNNNSQHHLQ